MKNVIIDLSHWEQDVDFKLAKEDGILGIMHKATQGLKYVDPTYEERRKAAGEEGLLWGAYHFGVGEKGKDQAEHFLEVIGNDSQVLLALDIEENKGNNITPEQAEDFVNQVHKATGRLPLIYGSAYFLQDFATPTLIKCPLWIARWGKSPMLPKGWNDWILWQYTDGQTGPEPHSVKGIGPCDRDKFNGTLEGLKKFWLTGENAIKNFRTINFDRCVMGFKNIFNKIIEFVLGSKLSIELDEYKSNFSFMVDVLVSSLKNDNKSNSAAIDGVVELKDKNNDLLDKLFANWQNKQRQLLYICISLLVVSILLIYSHLKSFTQLAGIIMSIFA